MLGRFNGDPLVVPADLEAGDVLVRQEDGQPARVGMRGEPEGRWKGGPFVMVLQTRREIVKEIVITPIKNGAFFDAQTTAVTLVSGRRISVRGFHIHGLVEEFAPDLPGLVHQLRADAVVHHLKKTPAPASLGDLLQDARVDVAVAAVEQPLEVD
nr:hypothetical protein Iba_chr05dCG15640 [Ipomoea batatas]